MLTASARRRGAIEAWRNGAALIKGGPSEGAQVIDVLVTRMACRISLAAAHPDPPHANGTGCTLASGHCRLWVAQRAAPLTRRWRRQAIICTRR